MKMGTKIMILDTKEKMARLAAKRAAKMLKEAITSNE